MTRFLLLVVLLLVGPGPLTSPVAKPNPTSAPRVTFETKLDLGAPAPALVTIYYAEAWAAGAYVVSPDCSRIDHFTLECYPVGPAIHLVATLPCRETRLRLLVSHIHRSAAGSNQRVDVWLLPNPASCMREQYLPWLRR